MTHGIDDRLAARNARILAVAQALGGANPAIVISLGGLVGQALAADPHYATLPVSVLQLGLAAGTIPTAIAVSRFGRRTAYVFGALIGILAGCLAAFAVTRASFPLFCLATACAGLYASCVNSYRFAAIDTASPAFRNRAISWVMLGGIAAAVVGPQTVIWTRDLVPGVPFAGGFLGQAGLALLSIGVIAALRTAPPGPVTDGAGRPGRPLGAIVRQPRFLLGVAAGTVSYGLMSLMMTAAPLAMVAECGLSVSSATLGIQWHILAMFAPSLVTGRLIDRFGREVITVTGLLLLAAAALAGLSGREIAHFWTALVLLGLGWNFGFIGATAMVTECYRPEERARVQAANDFTVFGTVAVSSFSSGAILGLGGWQAVATSMLPPIALVLLLFAAWHLRGRAAGTAT